MKSAVIRQAFLDFFKSKDHTIVPSSSLVPGNDPTLLFTNAGMVQFKDVFLGFDKRPYTRATTSQKCVRAGGKHNDLENVGYTARHHTFFEMLGNFSFGDYFKRDAILYAWEFLTSKEWLGLDADKLWVTVYAEDDEAYDIWHREVGIPVERMVRIGDNKGARYASDNFWMMGETGPCGPCTEIFYDHGPEIWGGPPGSPEEDGDRYIEIWNNVFMQFNRDEAGVMHPLPKPSVDTGMGLERIAAVLQHVHSNYEIDLFQALIQGAARETACSDLANPSLKVLADHIRACSFLISDGVIPGNEGRGYVLRRIIRRAIRHGYKLGVRKAFFHKLVPDLVEQMGAAYPELVEIGTRISDVLRQEEERFFETIANGMEILDAALAQLGGTAAALLDGETAFKLHDTYGFPLDLTADVCRERDVQVDVEGFEKAMDHQRQQARSAGKFRMATALDYSGAATTFHGYDTLVVEESIITALYVDGAPVDELHSGQRGVVVLDHTPFYAESGGQVGDSGELVAGNVCTTLFAVEDTLKIQADVFGHHGELHAGSLKVGDSVTARVDTERRAATMRNHSATHLMHKALREVLGDHVQQKGSQVDADKTRFDFAHNAPVSREQIARIEAIVNREVLANSAVAARVMAIDAARETGALMLFGEKYGDEVRVLDIGTSRELCGGTHVARTGDIGFFKVIGEGGVASGVRRIEAVTGECALLFVQRQEQLLADVAAVFSTPAEQVLPRITQSLESLRSLEKEVARLNSKLASSTGGDILAGAREVAGVKVLATVVEGADPKTLRDLLDQIKSRLESGVVLLAAVEGDKVSLTAGVTKSLTDRVKAGELMQFAAGELGGKGGGRPDMAQGGGSQPEKLPALLDAVYAWVSSRLG
ncbi:MAG: alanyl-tRNA synthetase [Gammaproteobacteria bacterium BRH_c0]|nr:MAG: alanyl-tRNA synthetase [Gammaproteobacteria bacterium BRH_c0]